MMTLAILNWFNLPEYEHCTRMCAEGLQRLACSSSALVGFIIALTIILLWAVNKCHRGFEIIANKLLLPSFFIVWILTFIVYDVGTYTGEPLSILGNAPMAVLHAFEAFILQSDVSAIHEPFHNSWFFMMWFSLAHFCAAAVSLVFVIKHFGFNIIASIKMRYKSWRIAGNKETTFIFWGLSDASYFLAKRINEHYKKTKSEDYRIIVVRTNNETENVSHKNGIERLFNFISLKNKDYDRLQDIHCLTTSTYHDLSNLNIQGEDNSNLVDVLRAHLRLRALRRIIRNRTTKELHIFLLNDDQQFNIKAVTNLKLDESIAYFAESDNHKIKFYCHARYNSVNRVIEDIDISDNIEVRIIDSSHLSIECLKKNVKYQPINFVDIDETNNYGTVSSVFTSLIIGFGEVGKDALRFLYEFGAFVDSNSTENETIRSQFNCHVVEKDIESMRGPIMSGSPSIFKSRNPQDNSLLVEFHDMSYNSDEFYSQLLDGLSDKLNYIVIAIGDDEVGMTLAVRILKYLKRKGQSFKKLRIFVHSKDDTQLQQMQKIADHYNRDGEKIVIFGKKHDEIFTYSMIIDDELEKKGQEYYEAYRRLNPENDEDGTWEQRRKKLLGQIVLKKEGINPKTGTPIFEETPCPKPTIATLDNLQRLRRKETQDKANALHEATKMKILEAIIPNWFSELVPKLYSFTQVGENIIVSVKRKAEFKDGKSTITYEYLSDKQLKTMYNLAKLEHLRWNASHEVLGYTEMPKDFPKGDDRGCVEATMEHNCLIPWEKLDRETKQVSYIKDYKLFDFGVVETTIDIYRRNVK